MREIPHSPVALYKAANLFGTLIAATILASVHVRARKLINRSLMREIPHSPVALYKAANLFGTLIAETILASVHVRARKQAGHMDASDLINAAAKHLARRRPSTYGECRIRRHSAKMPKVGSGRP